MAIYSAIVGRVSALLLGVICTIVPIAENLAYKLSVGGVFCECPSPASSPSHSVERGRKRKKVKKNGSTTGSLGGGGNVYQFGKTQKEVKRIKLLLDITVDKNGSQVLDIKARAREPRDVCPQQQPNLVLRILNLPSSILFYLISKLRDFTCNLDKYAKQPSSGDDANRPRKSPKRRISKGNYRKIIPFFPFNLLGFSNYSAFQMPTISRHPSSESNGAGGDETNNLNICGNGQCRSKRPRHSSTDESDTSTSDGEPSEEEISYLEDYNSSKVYPDEDSLSNSVLQQSSDANVSSFASGQDEANSDETGKTITNKRLNKSIPLHNSSSIQDLLEVELHEDPTSNLELAEDGKVSVNGGGGGGVDEVDSDDTGDTVKNKVSSSSSSFASCH